MVIDTKEAPQIFDPDLDIELEGSVLPLSSRGASQGLGFIDPQIAVHRLLEPEDKPVEAVRIRFCHRRDSTVSPRTAIGRASGTGSRVNEQLPIPGYDPNPELRGRVLLDSLFAWHAAELR
jgi:hypothetical protein